MPRVSCCNLLFSTLLIVTVVFNQHHRAAASNNELSSDDDPCTAPFLPTDLDLIRSIEQTNYREVHLHNEYRIGHDDFIPHLRGQSRNLTLKFEEEHEFRISISPGDTATFSLQMFRIRPESDGEVQVTQSRLGGANMERQIFALIDAKTQYTLRIIYNLGENVKEKCPTVFMELALQPTKNAKKFTDACATAGEPYEVPAIYPPVAEAPHKYQFQSAVIFAPLGKGTEGDAGAVAEHGGGFLRILSHHAVTIPHLPGRHQKWKFRLELGTNFLDGGDIVALLTVGNASTAPTPRDCGSGKTHCYYGGRPLRNTFVIQEILWAGDDGKAGEYVLWFALRTPESVLRRTCAPYQFKIDVFPLPEEETFLNCDLDPLPKSFHEPGMYDNRTGVMFFTDNVLINLTERHQRVLLKPSKKQSLLRASIGPHPSVDVDLHVYDVTEGGRGKLLALSAAAYKPDGVILELDGDKIYAISAEIPSGFRRYTKVDHDFYDFCDSFVFMAHVFPLPDSNGGDDTCETSSPDVGDISEDLSNNKKFSFGKASLSPLEFKYSIDGDSQAQQATIMKKRFHSKNTVTMNIVASADTYGGTPVIEVVMIGVEDRPMYSEPRTFGSGLYAMLEAGEYEIRILTPEMQFTSKKWSELAPNMPRCLRYNLRIDIQEELGCLYPLPLPSALRQNPHGHHHLIDEFKAQSSIMKLSPKDDSVLHALVDWTDAPVKIKLFKGSDTSGTPLATSFETLAGKGGIELYDNVEGNSEYTLVFDFEAVVENEDGDGKDAKQCRSFHLQLSMTPHPSSKITDCDAADDDENRGHKYLRLPVPIELGVVDNFKPTTRSSSMLWTFNIVVDAHVRVVFDYPFSLVAISTGLCPCDHPSNCLDACIGAAVSQNELDIPPTLIKAGNFTVVIRTWQHHVHGRDLNNECSPVGIRLAVAPLVQHSTPPLCPLTRQYLPPSLNRVGALSPYYNNEVHFLQKVLINSKHFLDQMEFTLSEKSILRAHIPQGSVYGSFVLSEVHANGNSQDLQSAIFGRSLLATLAPGKYFITIKFSLQFAGYDPSRCQSVPFEFSIVKADDMKLLGVDQDKCDGSDPFPSTMALHHGHHTLYRAVGKDHVFNKMIQFNVGERGGNLDLDIRYNFQAAALSVSLEGMVMQANQQPRIHRIPIEYLPDRSFVNAELQQGQYTLTVYDPVSNPQYEGQESVVCSPYSVHMRFLDRGNFTDNVPVVTAAPGDDDAHHGGAATVLPSLDCPSARYDFLPSTLPLWSDEQRWFNIHGQHYRIPFDTAEQQEVSSGAFNQKFMVAVTETSFTVHDGEYIRVWQNYAGNGALFVLRLFYENATEPFSKGLFWGWKTQSVAVAPRMNGGDRRQIRLEVRAFFKDRPAFPKDFSNCDEKLAVTSYELYFSAFPFHNLDALTLCPATDDDANKEAAGDAVKKAHSPPTTVEPSKPYALAATRFYFTKEDCKASNPEAWKDNTGGMHSQFRVPVTCSHNIDITIPEKAKHVFLAADLKYNLLTSDFRMILGWKKNDSIVAGHMGGPVSERDEQFNALTQIHAEHLQAGEYVLVIQQGIAEQRVRDKSTFCIPYEFSLSIGKEDAGNNDSDQDKKGPVLIDFQPMSSNSLDVSDPLSLTLTFDSEVYPQLKKGHWVAKLVDEEGNSIRPSSQYFQSRTEIIVVYSAYRLQWGTTYTVALDLSAIVMDNAPVDKVLLKPTYKTAYCGCDQGFCAPGGSCSCQEPDGTTCETCYQGTQLSQEKVALGSPKHSIMRRVCQWKQLPGGDAQTQSPPPPLQHKTSAPWSDDSGSGDGNHHTTRPPHHNPPVTSHPIRTRNPTPSATAGPIDDSTNTHSSSTINQQAGNATATDSQRPSLKLLRVVLSSFALVVLGTFALVKVYKLRGTAQRQARFNNPFRREENTSDDTEIQRAPVHRGATGVGPAEDDEDADDNDALVPSRN